MFAAGRIAMNCHQLVESSRLPSFLIHRWIVPQLLVASSQGTSADSGSHVSPGIDQSKVFDLQPVRSCNSQKVYSMAFHCNQWCETHHWHSRNPFVYIRTIAKAKEICRNIMCLPPTPDCSHYKSGLVFLGQHWRDSKVFRIAVFFAEFEKNESTPHCTSMPGGLQQVF